MVAVQCRIELSRGVKFFLLTKPITDFEMAISKLATTSQRKSEWVESNIEYIFMRQFVFERV